MVTQLVLVQLFQVRVLVSQQQKQSCGGKGCRPACHAGLSKDINMRVRVPSRLQVTRVCCNGCIRILEIRGRGSNPPLSTKKGTMVEWFTMPPCHGVRCGFESRWSRKYIVLQCSGLTHLTLTQVAQVRILVAQQQYGVEVLLVTCLTVTQAIAGSMPVYSAQSNCLAVKVLFQDRVKES